MLTGFFLVIAAALRIRGASNDLWLDEIWSLKLAGQISSPLQVFTNIHQDNNHYLNTLWLYICGFRGDWVGYRIVSIVAGVGSVALAGMIGRRRDARTAGFAMALVALGYVQILYSSEARGYSTVVLFSFLSFYELDKFLEKQDWRSAVLFSISSILGFASHLVFFNFFCAAWVWSAWHFAKSGLGLVPVIKRLLACHAAPAVFLLVLYFVDIRHQVALGGTGNGAAVYLDSFAWTFGSPPGRLGVILAGLLAAGLFLAGVSILRREGVDSWVFFVGVIVVFPILLMIVRHSDVLYVRYFIVGMSFLLLLFGVVLATLWRGDLLGRILCACLTAGFIGVNGWLTSTLFTYGRGDYSDAARFLAEHTKGSIVTVGGDIDFRIGTVVEFYGPLAMGGKTVKYYVRKSWPRGGPEWFISQTESVNDPVPPGEQFTDETGNIYEWVKSFQSAPLSGLHWFVCHNAAK